MYQLVWSDDFNYEGKPDPKKWDIDVGGHGFGNAESQYYTDRMDNVYVKDGLLHICGMKEKYKNCEYTSAKITTKGKKGFQYGKFLIKAKLPKGIGTWPAIWFLPESFGEDNKWPQCGEIDFVEHIGRKKDHLHFSLHTGLYNHKNDDQYETIKIVEGVTDRFVEYGMVWTKEKIEFYIDDKKVVEYIAGDNGKDSGEMGWPFHQPFYLIINFALGGYWGGEIDDSSLQGELLVKYVKYFEKIE